MKKLKEWRRVTTILLIAIFMVVAGTLALTNPAIPRYFLGAGGQSSGGVYILTGSIGQYDAGGTLQGGDYTLAGGFWAHTVETQSDSFVYLPLLIR